MISTWLREGEHEFSFPFVGYDNNIGNAQISLVIGKDYSVNKGSGFIFTVIVAQLESGGPQLEHFIENICTSLKTWIEAHLSRRIEESEIRWYQTLPPQDEIYILKKVTMIWDPKKNLYHSAQWSDNDLGSEKEFIPLIYFFNASDN